MHMHLGDGATSRACGRKAKEIFNLERMSNLDDLAPNALPEDEAPPIRPRYLAQAPGRSVWGIHCRWAYSSIDTDISASAVVWRSTVDVLQQRDRARLAPRHYTLHRDDS